LADTGIEILAVLGLVGRGGLLTASFGTCHGISFC
jgi:hypothetical protein